jgi:hypothetical protein
VIRLGLMKRFTLCFLLCAPAFCQSTRTGAAVTSGTCSPANTGNQNTFNITCGIGKEQGQKLLNLLNQVLAKQLNPDIVAARLDEIRNGVAVLRTFGSPTEGVLRPGSWPDPPAQTSCPPPPPGALRAFLGSGAGLVWATSDRLVVLSGVDGEEFLAIKRSPDGASVDATVLARDGKLFAQIKDSVFVANPNNTLKRNVPDPSTLEVIDEYGKEVLHVRYLNQDSLSVRGTFRSRTGKVFDIGETGIETFVGTMIGLCSAGAPTGIVIQ